MSLLITWAIYKKVEQETTFCFLLIQDKDYYNPSFGEGMRCSAGK